MVKVTKSGNQYRINIPKEIILQTGWDESTELNIFPYLKDLDEEVTSNTPIVMKKINIQWEKHAPE